MTGIIESDDDFMVTEKLEISPVKQNYNIMFNNIVIGTSIVVRKLLLAHKV